MDQKQTSYSRDYHLFIFIALNALLYLIFGAWCAIDPFGTSTAVGLSIPSNQGFAEFVAVYGGLEFGIGLFLTYSLLSRSLQRSALIFLLCFYFCLFAFRTWAISQVGFDIGAGVNFYIAEALFTLWSLYLIKTRVVGRT